MARQLVEAVLIGLAGWRMANLLIDEDGPFDIFERLRQFVGVREGIITGFFPKLFTCVYCMSIWTIFGAYIIWLFCPVLVMLMAGMTIAIVTDSHIRRS